MSVSNNVVITSRTKTENPNYLFVTIDTKNVKAQELQFTFTNGKKTFKKDFEIKKANALMLKQIVNARKINYKDTIDYVTEIRR